MRGVSLLWEPHLQAWSDGTAFFLHHHHHHRSLTPRQEREPNGEEAVLIYLNAAVPLVPWNDAMLGTCAITAGGRRKQTGTSQVDHKTVV